MSGIARSGTWSNWAGNYRRTPAAIARPSSVEEVSEAVLSARAAKRGVKVIGGSHSFTDIAATDGTLMTLDGLSGVVRADSQTGLVTLRGGTRLSELPRLLTPYGLALPNMGDIDQQSIAGAISTSTHGTGLAFTGYGGMVRGLTLVLADGSLVSCSPAERPDLFDAARVGLGAFGVVVEVTLQLVPRFRLHAVERPEPLEEVLDSFQERVRSADHVEFYWFPGTDRALTKTNTRLPADAQRRPVSALRGLIDDELLSNGVYSLTCQLGARFNQAVPVVNRVANRLLSAREYVDDSHAVFTSPRRVRFREMEYALPLERADEILRRVIGTANGFGEAISFPLEVRVTAADDVWMSTATGRPSLYIAAHRYHREPHAEYFEALERVFQEYEGRPHWGKLHSMQARQLRPLYPRFDDVLEQRALVDPEGRFLNPYLRRVLGV
jgi:L-gulonolactone oxidase